MIHGIHGNTYPVKEELKAMGCRWSKASECWVTSDEAVRAKAQALVDAQPKKAAKSSAGNRDMRIARRNARTGDYYTSGLYDLQS